MLLLLLSTASSCGINEIESKIGECLHKSAYPPNMLETISYVLIFLICNLTNATGVGGGGLLVPLLILLMGFQPHYAIPLSKSIIFGGAVISVLLSLRQSKILIDFRIVSIFQPMILLGTILGVSFNKFFPESITLLLLISTLLFIIYKNITKAIQLFREETINKQQNLKFEEEKDDELVPNEIELVSKDSFYEQTFRNFGSRPKSKLPKKSILLIFVTFMSMIVFALLRGGSEVRSVLNIEPCSAEFWFLSLFCVVYYTILTVVGYHISGKNLNWGVAKAIKYCLVAFFGGIGSGMLGIGGGLIISPLFLDIGMSPEIASASSSLMVLFTSSSTSLQFLINGFLLTNYAVFLLFISMVASVTGGAIVSKLIKKYKRPSIIVLILCVIAVASTILLPVYYYKNFKESFSFSNLC